MAVRCSRTWSVILLGMLAAVSCKEVGNTGGEGDADDEVLVARPTDRPEFYAADPAYIQKNSNFYYKVWDDSFTRRLEDLPANGEVSADRRPYLGGYYSEPDGGTHVVMSGGKSPLQKFDEAFNGGTSKAVTWEVEKHRSSTGWAGHCNGYSAAAVRHPKEPFKNVVRNGVEFSPKDIKALMAEIYMNADYEFLGGNRCELEKSALKTPDSRSDKTKMDECEDINPGTMHVVLGNWIGKAKHALIMDMSTDLQVWNYPLYKYTSTRRDISATEARNLISGVRANYVFNPGAAKFVHVQTQLSYVDAQRTEVLGQFKAKTIDLSYILELNAAGEILGGEWTTASQKNHPDFLWVALDPLEPNGTRYMGNPHVKSDAVLEMWAESAGYTLQTAPKGIRRPPGIDDWGRWASFEVTLDGNTHGAVFAGKDAQMKIKRKDGLTGSGISLEILLNGLPLKNFDAGEIGTSQNISYAFQPPLGPSRFQFVWRRDDTVVDDEYLRFHVVR